MGLLNRLDKGARPHLHQRIVVTSAEAPFEKQLRRTGVGGEQGLVRTIRTENSASHDCKVCFCKFTWGFRVGCFVYLLFSHCPNPVKVMATIWQKLSLRPVGFLNQRMAVSCTMGFFFGGQLYLPAHGGMRS